MKNTGKKIARKGVYRLLNGATVMQEVNYDLTHAIGTQYPAITVAELQLMSDGDIRLRAEAMIASIDAPCGYVAETGDVLFDATGLQITADCIQCGACLPPVCPANAIQDWQIMLTKCIDCGKCVTACASDAIVRVNTCENADKDEDVFISAQFSEINIESQGRLPVSFQGTLRLSQQNGDEVTFKTTFTKTANNKTYVPDANNYSQQAVRSEITAVALCLDLDMPVGELSGDKTYFTFSGFNDASYQVPLDPTKSSPCYYSGYPSPQLLPDVSGAAVVLPPIQLTAPAYVPTNRVGVFFGNISGYGTADQYALVPRLEANLEMKLSDGTVYNFAMLYHYSDILNKYIAQDTMWSYLDVKSGLAVTSISVTLRDSAAIPNTNAGYNVMRTYTSELRLKLFNFGSTTALALQPNGCNPRCAMQLDTNVTPTSGAQIEINNWEIYKY